MQTTPKTSIQIFAAVSAVMDAYGELFKEDTGGVITKTEMGNRAIVREHFGKLPEPKQQELLEQFPELAQYVKK